MEMVSTITTLISNVVTFAGGLEGKEAQTSRKMLAYRGHGWKKQLGRCPVNHVKTSHSLLGTSPLFFLIFVISLYFRFP